jgi:hypothetical protein
MAYSGMYGAIRQKGPGGQTGWEWNKEEGNHGDHKATILSRSDSGGERQARTTDHARKPTRQVFWLVVLIV